MKTNSIPNKNDGFALITVLCFIATMTTFMAMLAVSSSQRAYTAKRLTNQIKAQAMAEAGCVYGHAILSGDDTKFSTEFSGSSSELSGSETPSEEGAALNAFASLSPAATDSEARFDYHVSPQSSLASIITSTGTCGSVSSVSIVSVQKIPSSQIPSPTPVLDEEAFEYAILCGGELKFRGCGTIGSSSGADANFHANGAIDNRGDTHALINLSSSTRITSGNVTFGGDLTAPSFGLHKNANVNGTKTQKSVAAIAIPDIDLTPYYNWALDHGEVYSGGIPNASHTPNGGIMWVNGDVLLSQGTINGTIIATGNIHISGNVDVKASSTCAFSLVSRDGDIQITSSGTIDGLLYAKSGSLKDTANGEIKGQIIVKGNIDKGGNSDILAEYEQNLPSPPGDNPITSYVAITAWQK